MESLGPYQLNTIITGDARELAKAIPDSSVDFIFTDPVYDRIDDYRWLAETAARVLRPHKSVLAFCPSVMYDAAIQFKVAGLSINPLLEHYNPGSVSRLFKYSLQMNLIPCLWASRGTPDSKWQFLQALSIAKGERGHKWGKVAYMIGYRLVKFTEANDIVVDFFCGGGTVPAVCKMLGRNYLAFEIDPATADNARRRVEMTQPPLFVLQPEQMEIPLE